MALAPWQVKQGAQATNTDPIQQKISYLANLGISKPDNISDIDFLGQYYSDPYGDEAADFKPQTEPTEPTGISSSDVEAGFGTAGEKLKSYEESLAPLQDIGYTTEDLTKLISDVNYTPFDWEANQPTYNETPYEKTTYDFADQYVAPEAYEATQYSMPDIEGVSESAWGAEGAGLREKTAQQYADTREQMREELLKNPARREQAAALMANVGQDEAAAQIAAARDLAIEKAKSDVETAKAQAQLTLSAEEAQAAELANKYNLDIDAARYLVSQAQAQETAQAAENQYATTYQSGEEKYKTSLAQTLAEEKAAEEQKKYESEYGQAQDIAALTQSSKEAEQAAQVDYANALLQAEEAASTQAAQQATYQTNLTEEERNKANEAQTNYEQQKTAYDTATGTAGTNKQLTKTQPRTTTSTRAAGTTGTNYA